MRRGWTALTALVLALGLLPASAWAQDRAQTLRQSTQLRQAGRFAEAARLLRDFLATHPQDARMALSLGDAVAMSGDVEGAVTEWTAMLDRVPPRPDHYVNVSRRLRRLGRPELAIEILQRGVDEMKNEAFFTWDLGELYLETGRGEEAVSQHMQLLQSEPHRLMQMQSMLDVLALRATSPTPDERLTRYTRALQNQVTVESPVAAQLLLAHALLVSGQPAAGFGILAPLADRPASRETELITGALAQFAERCEQLGHTDLTVRTYGLLEQVTGDGAFTETSLRRRAVLQARRGNGKVAMELYRRLAGIAGTRRDAAAYELEIGRLALATGDPQTARPILERLSSSNLLNVQQRQVASQLLVEVLWQLEDLPRVFTFLEEAVTRPEDSASARLGLIVWAILNEETEVARAHADTLARLHPEAVEANDALQWLDLLDHIDSPDALKRFALARLRLRQHRPEDAARLTLQLLEEGLGTLAHELLLEAAGRAENTAPDQARALYGKILADDTASSRLRYAATLADARLQAAAGEVAEAVQRLETLLLQFPTDPRAPVALAELQRLRQLQENG